jgi:signal transduction histidine kinase
VTFDLVVATIDRVGELGRLLDVLRDAGPEVGLAPQPTLAELPDLLAQTESAGLPVALHTEGEPRPLPAGVELAVYRIVQEALTNTRKHAGPGASASVVLTYAPHEIGVEVSDDGDAGARVDARVGTAVAGTGHGLVGMRERVTAYGGRLAAGRSGGSGFTVSARIPVQAGE